MIFDVYVKAANPITAVGILLLYICLSLPICYVLGSVLYLVVPSCMSLYEVGLPVAFQHNVHIGARAALADCGGGAAATGKS